MAVIEGSVASRRTFDFATAIKESALTAFVIFALTAIIVGLRTVDIPGGLSIQPRFGAVIVATAVAFVFRFLLVMLREGLPIPAAIGFGVMTAYLIPVSLFPDLAAYRPFGDVVVDWLLALATLGMTIRAANQIRSDAEDLSAEQREARKEQIAIWVQRVAIYLGPAILVFAIVFPFLWFVDRRLLDIAILILTYVMLGWGLNIVVGLAGLLDLGYVAFYAVGAYSYALLATHYGLSFWICLPFAGIMAAFAGILLGFPVLRLRGDYLAIVTLGFGEIVRIILLNWYEFTNGPDGISGIERPTFFGLQFARNAAEGEMTFHQFFNLPYSTLDRFIFLYYIILVLALITNLFTMRIRKLPVGRAWEALREDEIACRSLGINARNTKLTAFGIGAMFAGFAGSFFATRQTFVSPESFTFIESAVILAIVVLGGFGSQIGVVVAAILLIGLPEFFRELQQYRMLFFGAAMVLIMLWRPQGLLAHREPTLRLFGRGHRPASAQVAAKAAGEAAK